MRGWSKALAALASVVLFTNAAEAQQFTMKLSSPTVNDAPHEWMKAFKAGVEQRSGGKIKVEIYPASQLRQIPATVEGVSAPPSIWMAAHVFGAGNYMDTCHGIFVTSRHAGSEVGHGRKADCT